MKPSERIEQIAQTAPDIFKNNVEIYPTVVLEALIKYLDEEWEKKQNVDIIGR